MLKSEKFQCEIVKSRLARLHVTWQAKHLQILISAMRR